MRAYGDRPITPNGLITHGDWTLKSWTIVYGDARFDAARFAEGRGLALSALPTPAQTPERPGVGFLIEHQGNAVDYIVLGWWDRENELPLRVFVSDGRPWRPAQGSESICVWDLQVIWQERTAYVASFLSGNDSGARSKYLTFE